MKVVYLLQNPGVASRTPPGWESAFIRARVDEDYSAEELATIDDADVLVVGLEPVGEALLSRAKRLRLVQRLGGGYCNVDVQAATRRGIPVSTLADFNAASVAEHTIMLVLALLRRVFESTLLMKAGQWPLGDVVGAGIFDLQGKTLGLLGYGAIGRAVAERARPFEAAIVYHDSRGPAAPEDSGARYVPFEELLARSDVLSIHVPLTAETRGLIGERELRSMKRRAILVNTARGAVVDELGLARALSEGTIAGAGLDVYADEPLDPRHPLRRCANVLLTPHTAGQTREAMERMVAGLAGNLERVARGEEPLYRVA